MKKLLIAFFMIASAPLSSWALTKVQGTVLEEIVNKEGEAPQRVPLVGAAACVKETNICVMTDKATGNFSFNVEESNYNNPQIEISAAGYTSQTFPLSPNIGTVILGATLDESTVIAKDKCNETRTLVKLNATKAKWIETGKTVSKSGDETAESICIPTECDQPKGQGYLLENPNTPNAVCTLCAKKIPKSVQTAIRNGKCIATSCQPGYDTNADGSACISTKCGCGNKWDKTEKKCVPLSEAEKKCKPTAAGATAGVRACNNGREVCQITACDTENYDLVGTGINAKCESKVNKPCNPNTANATSGKYVKKDNKLICQPICDGTNYVAQLAGDTYSCVLKSERDGTDCTKSELSAMNVAHATGGTVKEWDKTTGMVKSCTITECDTGYLPNIDGTACDQICTNDKINELKNGGAYDVTLSSDGKTCVAKSCKCEYTLVGDKCEPWSENDKQCTPTSDGATAGVRACNNGREVCQITACDEPKYTMVGDTCVSNDGKPCNDEIPLPENATAGTLHNENGKMTCVATACANGFDLNRGECVPKMALSKEQYQDEIAELQKNADAMHERETSLANRAIGAAGIGAVGIGGSMLGAALSERASDADAEATTRAYLETFRCDYGAGKNIRGGEVNVGLPGGNDMIKLYTEYADTAIGLKKRKDALGIRPGIESEIVIDKSQTGLYDDVGTGITGGTYASIARALMNPDGEDATMWAAQRAATQNKLVAGAITAGVGAAGSLAANIAVNHNNPDQSKKIMANYDKYRVPFKQAESKINGNTPRNCAALFDNDSQVTGTYPACSCKDETYYFKFEEGCIQCTDNLKVNSDKTGCECKQSGYVWVSGTTKCEPATSSCTIKKYKKSNECKCIDEAIPTESGDCKCDEAKGYKDDGNNGCTMEEKPTASGTQHGDNVFSLNLKTSALFKSGYANLKDNSTEQTIKQAVTKAISDAKQNSNGTDLPDLKTSNDYCLWVVGKADHQGFLKSCKENPGAGKYCDNMKLSKARADTVKNVLMSTNEFNKSNIMSYGMADADCPAAIKNPPEADEQCRVVEVALLQGSCQSIAQSGTLGSIIKNSGVVSTAVDALQQTITAK